MLKIRYYIKAAQLRPSSCDHGGCSGDVPAAWVVSPHPAHLKGCGQKEYRKGGGILNASPELVYFAAFTLSPLTQ